MSDTVKKILISTGVFLLWVLTIIGFYIYHTHQEEIFKEQLRNAATANTQLEKELSKANTQLDYLLEKQESLMDIAESSSTVLNELRDSVDISGSTIKEIKEQQQRIKAAVLALVEEYNKLLNQLGEKDAD